MATIAKDIIHKIAYEIDDENIERFPPQVYLNILNQSIRTIFNWLILKKIYVEIQTHDISIIAGVEQYIVLEGKTIAIYYNDVLKIEKKEYEYKFNFLIKGFPQYYFETINKIGFIPTPSINLLFKRHYVPSLNIISSFESNVPFPAIFDKLILTEACLQTINLIGDPKWIKAKVDLFSKWREEKIIEQDMLSKFYQPIKEQQNFFIE